MNLQNKLDQFRDDNPYDFDTQAKRLVAKDDKELILYVLALGFATAKQRQRHLERDFIKNTGTAPPERLVPGRPIIKPVPEGKAKTIIPGRASGTVTRIKITPNRRIQNAMERLVGDVWTVGDKKLNDCNRNDLKMAENRAEASANGQMKNKTLYANLRATLVDGKETVGMRVPNAELRQQIEKVYGEFRTKEAA
jgi:hypothetical protein